MDPLEFGSLARIRILLLPVGNIKRSAFEQWSAEIRSFDNVRLGDIPADTREDRARFMPNPLASGHIHLSYTLHPPPPTHQTLSLFRPADFPMGVLGIASATQNDSFADLLAQFNSTLSELFPDGALFPLANNCLVFEESDGSTNINLGNLPGLVVIPGMMGNKRLYVGTLLADLCSNILAEFATVVQSLETPLGNEYLNATLFPTLPPVSELPKPLENDNHVRSSLPPLPSQHSQPELPTVSSLLRAKTPTTLSVKRNSSIGPGPPLSPFRQSSLPPPKKKQTIGAVSSHGRLYKVLGDFFLLAGRTMDASIWYSEAVTFLKSTQDAAWQASALEGLATIPVLEAWSNQANGTSEEKEPWTDIADKLVQAEALYSRFTPPADADTNMGFMTWLYIRTVLRHTALLFSVWAAKGWGPLAFSMLLHGDRVTLPPTLTQESEGSSSSKRVSYNSLERLTSITGISRSTIANVLAQAHGPWLLHLGPRERLSILENVAATYGILGYLRKEAYILREVLGCVMDLVVCGREEDGATKIAGAGLGIQGVNVGEGKAQGTVGIRTNDNSEGNESVLRIVKQICRVHGIDLEAVKIFTNLGSAEPEASPEDDESPETPADPYGWPELQIGIVREAIAVAEALPDYAAVAQFSLSALKTLHLVMSHSDQPHMYSVATRALATVRRRGDNRCVDYWSGKPITSIEVLPLPIVRLPLEKPISLLSHQQGEIPPILMGMTDPFLYNPRRLSGGQAATLLVQNESFEVVVTLRNPYVIDLELSRLSLSTSGVGIESKPMSLAVPANSYHPVTISALALESGTLTIRGCIVQALGGAPREFLLPLSTDDEEIKQARRRSTLECETGRSKRAGLDSRPWEKKGQRASITASQPAVPKFIQCQVVPEQPLLRIRRTSLTHGAVMLYDGERSIIRITLENVSSLPIDFIRLTFDDSTIAPAQQALADGELSVYDTYETEYDLIHRPVFTWDSKRDSQRADPGGKTVVTVNCFGKVGCTHGTIHVSYSYCRRPQPTLDKPPETFHARQLSYPVLVTVYHMLECHGMDIMPYSPDIAHIPLSDATEPEDPTCHKTALSIQDPDDWCIFSVEVRNTYGIPFEVTFEREQPDAPQGSRTMVVPPGSTSRVLIPIKKFALPEDDVAKAIPTLSDRQFVVSKSNLSEQQERTQRELFWYREALFKYVRGRWKENGGIRTGELSLRQQRMTQPMLNMLRLELSRLHLSLWRRNDETGEPEEVSYAAGAFRPPLNELVYLRTKITNLDSSRHTFVVNLVLDPVDHVLFEGVTNDIPIGRLDSGQSHEFETPLTFVSCGRFEITGSIVVPGHPELRDRLGSATLRAVVYQ